MTVNNAAEARVEQISQNNAKTEELIKMLTNSMSNLDTEFAAVHKRLNEISSIFAGLYKVSADTNDSTVVSDGFKAFSLTFKGISNTFEESRKSLELNLRENFCFIRKEKTEFAALLRKLEGNKNAYLKAFSKLKARKEDLFSSKNVQKWNVSQDLSNEDLKKCLNDKKEAFSVMLPKVWV